MNDSEFNKTFSRNLNQLMNEYGLSQSEFAKRLGVSGATVSHWCNGIKTPRMDKVDKMCEMFHVSRSFFIEERKRDELILSDAEAKLIHEYREMKEQERRHLISYMNFLCRKDENE